jgi:hypothetical protein
MATKTKPKKPEISESKKPEIKVKPSEISEKKETAKAASPQESPRKFQGLPEPSIEETIDKVDKQPKPAETFKLPSGAFDEPEEPEISETVSENVEVKPSEISDKKPEISDKPKTQQQIISENPLSVTFMIDSIFGFVGIFFFDNASMVSLTPQEMTFYESLEKRCGVELYVNSPFFYFGMLGVCYAGKITIMIKAKNKMKQIEEQQKEKPKKAA